MVSAEPNGSRHRPSGMRIAICLITAAVLFSSGCAGDSKDSGMSSPASAPEVAADRGTAQNSLADSGAARQKPQAEPKVLTAPDQRAVVYTANLRVRAEKVDDAAAQAKQFVLGAGGYVDNENSTTDPVSAHLTFKIPADRYPTVLDQLTKQLGKKLRLEQKAEDVTEQVADVDSRVKSAESALTRLRTLLNKANTVGEVLNVSNEIDQRQSDLESLQARQKTLTQRTTFGTVSLSLIGPTKAKAEPEEEPTGFLGGLESGWNAFTSFLSGLAAAVGWILPFAGLILLLGLPYLAIRRRRKPVRPEPEEELTPR